MNASEMLQLRLNSQMLLPESAWSVQEVVSRMGAMQAQDYTSMKWAIGCRAQGSTENEVEAALDNGNLLRTHVLRPTWHVVAANDIRWMVELTAPRIRNRMKPRDRQLGLTPEIIKKSKSILVKAMEFGNHKTKEELDLLWKEASIPTTEYRDAHLLMHAELDGLICSGKSIGKNRTYALMDERVPERQQVSRDEALARLATSYFNGHGPATMQDFIWWSGLTVGEAKQALESVKFEFQSETVGSQTFLFPNNVFVPAPQKDLVHPLPAFDEFIIAYQDRTATLIPEQFQKIVSNNGVFRPALLLDGKVVGVWSRAAKKDRIDVEITLFMVLRPQILENIKDAFVRYGHFHGLKTDVRFSKNI
jgi:hypothetical protein